jgi:hypothetical protein
MKDEYFKKDISIPFIFLLLFGSAIFVRFLPNKDYLQLLNGVLVIGTVFNLLSFISVVLGVIQRKRSSGVAFISFVCYFWFLIASNYVLISLHETRLQWILLLKPIDAFLLWSIIYLCNFPSRFQPPPHHSDKLN